MRWLESIIDSMYMFLSTLWEIVNDREAGHAAVLGVTKSGIQLSYCTITEKNSMLINLAVWQFGWASKYSNISRLACIL